MQIRTFITQNIKFFNYKQTICSLLTPPFWSTTLYKPLPH